MGLQERRKVQELKDLTLPERSREIAETCGKAIPYEVDWPCIENDAAALNVLDNLSGHRRGMALRMKRPPAAFLKSNRVRVDPSAPWPSQAVETSQARLRCQGTTRGSARARVC